MCYIIKFDLDLWPRDGNEERFGLVQFLGIASLLACRFHSSVPLVLALQLADFSSSAREGKQWCGLQRGYGQYFYS